MEGENKTAQPIDEKIHGDEALPLLVRRLIERRLEHRLVVSVSGLIIIGKAVAADTWIQTADGLNSMLSTLLADVIDEAAPLMVDDPRITVLRERLRWGTGLTQSQMETLKAAEAAQAEGDLYLHLVDAILHLHHGALPVGRWRLRLASIDGFTLLDPEENRGLLQNDS